MKRRLQFIIDNEGMSNLRFAEFLGVNPASVSHILSERNKPSFDFVAKIAEKLPHYNLRWLLTGIGEPLMAKPDIECHPQTIDSSEPKTTATEAVENDTSTAKAETIQGELPFNSTPEVSPQPSQSHTNTDRLIVCLPDGTFSEYTRRN